MCVFKRGGAAAEEGEERAGDKLLSDKGVAMCVGGLRGRIEINIKILPQIMFH